MAFQHYQFRFFIAWSVTNKKKNKELFKSGLLLNFVTFQRNEGRKLTKFNGKGNPYKEY